MIYTATLSGGSLRLRESRLVARLLLEGVDFTGWKKAVIEENRLQLSSLIYRRKLSRLLRMRLEPMGEKLWRLIRDGDKELATQACFACAVKTSRLLGDFLDLTLRDQRALFAEKLERRHWGEYLEVCRGRDPEMPDWSDSTIARLRSVVFSMLAEAGYLTDTRSLQLCNVFLRDELVSTLRELNETYVLRCMEVTG
jgi:hypothetical protein